MNCNIKIDEFEGPLDLLLHLVKKLDVDIWEISISEITNQYLEYIKTLEEMNLSVASEYLVMAAELIEIKSRMLLPKNKKEEEDEFQEDPKEALIKRLIEYKKYKEVTPKFQELEEVRKFIYTKLPDDLQQYSSDEIISTIEEENSPDLLLESFQRFLERKKLDQPLETKITKKEITIESRIKYIEKKILLKDKVKFEELFEIINKEYVITTFLAVLQLVKELKLIVTQENNFNDIYISKKECEDYE